MATRLHIRLGLAGPCLRVGQALKARSFRRESLDTNLNSVGGLSVTPRSLLNGRHSASRIEGRSIKQPREDYNKGYTVLRIKLISHCKVWRYGYSGTPMAHLDRKKTFRK